MILQCGQLLTTKDSRKSQSSAYGQDKHSLQIDHMVMSRETPSQGYALKNEPNPGAKK
jgi:hypothetical protein